MPDDTPQLPFSQRFGYKQPRSVFQIDDLDAETRMALWNIIYRLFTSQRNREQQSELVARGLWTEIYYQAAERDPGPAIVWGKFRDTLLNDPFHEGFDGIEFVLRILEYCDENLPSLAGPLLPTLVERLNQAMERYLVGYRLASRRFVQTTDDAEVGAIEEAIEASGPMDGVQHHLKTALRHLSSREHPDYANCAKESLSAVESLMERLTGKNVLSAALKKLPEGITVHPAQVAAWQSMYGWAGDEDGVRHSAQDMPRVDQAMAKYTLVTSSAFVNLMIAEANAAGVLMSRSNQAS